MRLGEALVSGLVTSDCLIVDKTTGRVVAQEIGDKMVMTVPASNNICEAPVPPGQRRQAVLNRAQAALWLGAPYHGEAMTYTLRYNNRCTRRTR